MVKATVTITLTKEEYYNHNLAIPKMLAMSNKLRELTESTSLLSGKDVLVVMSENKYTKNSDGTWSLAKTIELYTKDEID